MATAKFFGVALAATLAASTVTAQQGANDVDPNAPTLPPNTPRATGDAYFDFDVETLTGDIRCLGVEAIELNGVLHYVVSGAAAGASGNLYLWDATGTTLVTSFPQVSTSFWQGRDMESIPDGAGGVRLFIGSDNAEFQEYAISAAGVITHTATLTVNGVVGTIRALCTSDGGTTFYTKSFTSDFFEFTDQGAGVYNMTNQVFNSSVSAYGFGYSAGCGTIWSTDTGGNLTELGTDGQNTATPQIFYAAVPGSTFTFAAQGGLDLFQDPAGPTTLSAVHLVQGTPDHALVIEMSPCGPPPFSLAVSGLPGSNMTFDVANGTAGAPYVVIGGIAGSTSVAPAGPCGATTFPIDIFALPNAPRYIQGQLDGAGAGSITAPIPGAAAAVVSVTAFELGACQFSNVVAL